MLKTNMLKITTLCAGLALGGLPLLATAGEAVKSSGKESKQLVEEVKKSCITGDLGVTVVSEYISRGLVFENQGGIIQPYANLYFSLYEGDGFLNSIRLNLGIWGSFHSRKTDAGLINGTGTDTAASWYEFDFTPGVTFTFLKNFQFTPSYYWFISPNDGFSTFQGINLKLAYDDTDLLGAFALHPWVQVLFELENKAGNGSDEGIYYEVGIAPGFPIGPVSLTFPITAGFGSDEFYEGDENFGFVSGGVTAAYGLSFIPECYGTWTVTGGATYYYLGSGLDDFNPGVRDQENSEWVFSGGLGVAF
jgi:hypothetical protein